MDDNRGISKPFCEAFLNNGALSPYLTKVKKKIVGYSCGLEGTINQKL